MLGALPGEPSAPAPRCETRHNEQLSRSSFRLRGMGELLAGGETQGKGSLGSHRTTHRIFRGGAEVIWRGVSVVKLRDKRIKEPVICK